MSRVIGNPTSSPLALHSVASQHISTSLTLRVCTFLVVNMLRSSILSSRRLFARGTECHFGLKRASRKCLIYCSQRRVIGIRRPNLHNVQWTIDCVDATI
jgi:hypothetical protein